MKKQKNQKDYCVRFEFEEKHIPISKGINKDLKNYICHEKRFKENISIINYRKLSPKEQYKQHEHNRYPKNKLNKFYAYFFPKDNPFNSPPEELYDKELFGVFNISLGTTFKKGGSRNIKLKINSAQFSPN